MSDAIKQARCRKCGEVFPGPHDCAKAQEARSLFEAAKRANCLESADRLSLAALAAAIRTRIDLQK